MKIFDRINQIKNAWKILTNPSVELNDPELLEWLGISGIRHDLVSEVTYFTCLKMLSETMGKLPLKYYQQTGEGRIRADPTDATYRLTVRPNDIMTPSTLWGGTVSITETGMFGSAVSSTRRSMVVRMKYWISGRCRAAT